jgi:hypothetical protein
MYTKREEPAPSDALVIQSIIQLVFAALLFFVASELAFFAAY